MYNVYICVYIQAYLYRYRYTHTYTCISMYLNNKDFYMALSTSCLCRGPFGLAGCAMSRCGCCDCVMPQLQ